jgi:hypothetical protein
MWKAGSRPERPSSAQAAPPPSGALKRWPSMTAVAFSRNGDLNLGEFDDAVILKTFGEVPDDFAETQAA